MCTIIDYGNASHASLNFHAIELNLSRKAVRKEQSPGDKARLVLLAALFARLL